MSGALKYCLHEFDCFRASGTRKKYYPTQSSRPGVQSVFSANRYGIFCEAASKLSHKG